MVGYKNLCSVAVLVLVVLYVMYACMVVLAVHIMYYTALPHSFSSYYYSQYIKMNILRVQRGGCISATTFLLFSHIFIQHDSKRNFLRFKVINDDTVVYKWLDLLSITREEGLLV